MLQNNKLYKLPLCSPFRMTARKQNEGPGILESLLEKVEAIQNAVDEILEEVKDSYHLLKNHDDYGSPLDLGYDGD